MNNVINDASLANAAANAVAETKERYVAAITPCEAIITKGPQELFNALCFRQGAACEAFALETQEEANVLMHQRYPYRFYSNPLLYGRTPMGLPATGCFNLVDGQTCQEIQPNTAPVPLCSGSAAEPSMQPAPFIQPPIGTFGMEAGAVAGIFWSIDAMNGYTMASNLDELVYVLSNPALVYPHAVTWTDPNAALVAARNFYLARFFRRYDATKEIVSLPEQEMEAGDMFLDQYYENRENCRAGNSVLERLVSAGLI